MSTPPKKGFASFIRPMPPEEPPAAIEPSPRPMPQLQPPTLAPLPQSQPLSPPLQERVRHITSTGRVRTHSANRMLPGVTLRLSEERWERLKMLSIQERRPIQDILGEAMDAFMRSRGLPW